jgi:hypothetical protein
MSLVFLSREVGRIGHVVEVSLEGVEARGPHGPVGGEPLVDLLQGLAADAVEAALGVDAGFDQTGVAEDTEVLGDGRLADGKGLDEVSDRALAVPEEIEDAPAVALGQHLERRQHGLSIAI